MLLDGLTDDDPRVVSACARVLGPLGDLSPVAAALRPLVRTSRHDHVRAAAVSGLAESKSRDDLEILRAALGMESHQEVVRRAALRALVRRKDLGARTSIALLIRSGYPAVLREAAIDALVDLAPEDLDLLRLFRPLLRDANPGVRRGALGAFGRLGHLDSKRVLAELEKLEKRVDSDRDRKAVQSARKKIEASSPAAKARAGKKKAEQAEKVLRERELRAELAEIRAQIQRLEVRAARIEKNLGDRGSAPQKKR